ncbi:MerR family transcriptional regulator, glutamine synthetase repressor [Staphylococcus auricularis]|uniref:MerR family transcriptional regulator n=2 Tax=Staphylococcus auricularis TaxID=29379 RepID=A0AAP8PRH3_9STAP|nr:MerR family transcriptional regulator [Staphylococcus auricularis]MBM0867768.1 MerR family transcriptional regulator [Staphylococcus auricularis]MDC6326585.1 MerR family transcriptional regulator [Staphylococcus auricularis]MDN4532462.1 MerR family transcriptional regulator [Staphylococcus auricularis]PNZ69591.1 MerR family transcriptional regulator [Staphylococcus auricularis]SQJ10949.1 glutamine synthetase [Staphylococcus auricularis]
MQSRDSLRRNMAVFSMSIVSKLTELSARQIRYYETFELIKPERSAGNKRLFSLNDVEQLLHIKQLMEKGFNMKTVKQIINEEHEHLSKDEKELRKQMFVEATQKPLSQSTPINRGDLSRFIH